MRYFFEVLQLAIRSKLQFIMLILCSACVGLLWVANIGIFFPFLETIFFGETIPQSISRKIDVGKASIENWESEIGELKTDEANPSNQPRIQLVQSRIAEQQRQIDRLKKMETPAHRWLPGSPFRTVAMIVGFLVIASLLKGVFLAWNDILVARMTQSAVFQLRNRFFRHVMTLDLGYFSEERSARVTSRFTHDIQRVGEGVQKVLSQSFREPCKMFGCLIGAAFISWQLLLVSLLITPFAVIALVALSRFNKRVSHTSASAMSDLYARLSESLTGIRVVKSFGSEGYERRKFHGASKQIRKKIEFANIVRALVKPCVEVLGVSVISVGILVGGWLVLNQQTAFLGIPLTSEPISPAALLIFFGMLVGATDPLRKMSGLSVSVARSSAAAERVFKILQRPSKIVLPEHPVSIAFETMEIRFRGVSFSYPGEPQRALSEIDLTVENGECVALIGANGSGKSSLLNLLLRYYDPDEGEILINGVDLKQLNLKEFHRSIGVMQQQAFLFDETIEENIRYGLSWISSDEVEDAARRAGIHDEILSEFPMGYQTVVGESGNRLSGGQQQKIALARAFLKNPQLLLMDEASSQLDAAAESQLLHRLEMLMRGRTVLMISHRPALLSLATRIVLLQGGQIQEVGTHQELLQRSELYRAMNQHPLGGAA